MKKSHPHIDLSFINWTPAHIKKISRNSVRDTTIAVDVFIKKYSGIKNLDGERIMPELEALDTTRLVGTPLCGGDTLIDLLTLISKNKQVRTASIEASDFISTSKSGIFMKIELYNIIKNLSTKNIQPDTKNLMKKWLHYYESSGIHLTKIEQKKIEKINNALQKLQSEFQKNISEYHQKVIVPKTGLTGLTDEQLANFKQEGNSIIIGTSYPEFNLIMSDVDNDTVRSKVLQNFYRRGTIKNIKILSKIVTLRKELAKTLGKSQYLEITTSSNMIGTPQKLEKVLKDIQTSILQEAKKEQKVIHGYIQSKGDVPSLSNIAYFSKKYIKEKYDIDQNIVREYFPLEHCIDTCFKVFSEYFSLSFKQEKVTLWDNSVTLYSVYDKKTKKLFGNIALDLYPRDGKYTHACMTQPVSGEIIASKEIHPLVAMVANFPKPTKNTPSLLSLYEVETLLHEFGHILHGVLSKVRYISQSGTRTAVDYVEIPSQFMERFLYDASIMKMFSKHYITGKKLPVSLLDKLLKSEHRGLATQILNQFVNIELDTRIHADTRKDSLVHNKEIREYYHLLPEPANFLRPASFGHLSSQMYGNAYWVYMLSNIFALDTWGQVISNQKISKNKTREFRKNILETGSSTPEYETLKKFLKRNPNGLAFKKYIKKSFM
jgi:thimet oligopeptidase